jgi:hypothetical protein
MLIHGVLVVEKIYIKLLFLLYFSFLVASASFSKYFLITFGSAEPASSSNCLLASISINGKYAIKASEKFNVVKIIDLQSVVDNNPLIHTGVVQGNITTVGFTHPLL